MWEADSRKGPFPLHVLSCFGRLKSVLFIFCVFWIFEMAGFFSSVIIILLCVCQVLSGVNASKVKSFLLQTALSQKLKEVRRWGLCFSSDDLNVVGRFYNAIHHGSDINRRDQRVCHLYFHFILSWADELVSQYPPIFSYFFFFFFLLGDGMEEEGSYAWAGAEILLQLAEILHMHLFTVELMWYTLIGLIV